MFPNGTKREGGEREEQGKRGGSAGKKKAPPRCVRGNTHRSGEPVRDGGGPHEASTMGDTDVRALWFSRDSIVDRESGSSGDPAEAERPRASAGT
ncbi:hypothetical protein GCM10018775_36680 [Streptomyces umbrinus]|nr:hypothetical protein GCM10018775_36680 [Streptomyces umbrinus]